MNADWLNDPDFAPMDTSLEARVKAELDDKETLVWVGRPGAGRMVWEAVPTFLFGIPFTAFALFWISSTLMAGNPRFPFALFGVPFMLMGLFLLGSPVWAWLKAMRSCYAVTDRRAIICEPRGLGSNVRSYAPQGLGSIARNQRADGSGDLVFEELIRSSGKSRRIIRRGFLAIENVRAVEGLIRSTLLSPK